MVTAVATYASAVSSSARPVRQIPEGRWDGPAMLMPLTGRAALPPSFSVV